MNHRDTESTEKKLLEAIHRVFGASSYERYCDHLKRKGREAEIPTAEQFYLDSLKRRYATVSRCC